MGRIADRIGGQAVLEFGIFGAFFKDISLLFMDRGTVLHLLYIDTLLVPLRGAQ